MKKRRQSAGHRLLYAALIKCRRREKQMRDESKRLGGLADSYTDVAEKCEHEKQQYAHAGAAFAYSEVIQMLRKLLEIDT